MFDQRPWADNNCPVDLLQSGLNKVWLYTIFHCFHYSNDNIRSGFLGVKQKLNDAEK